MSATAHPIALRTHPNTEIHCPRLYEQAEYFLDICSSSPCSELGLDESPVAPAENAGTGK